MHYPCGKNLSTSERIKQTWYYLTDDEIAAHEDMRDIFFMAVKKKHGVPRAQAESTLRSLLEGLHFMHCATV